MHTLSQHFSKIPQQNSLSTPQDSPVHGTHVPMMQNALDSQHTPVQRGLAQHVLGIDSTPDV